MDWQQIGTWLGISGGTMAIIGPVIKWLVGDWYKKQRELQDLKYSQNTKAIERLDNVVEDMKANIRAHEHKLLEHQIKLEQAVTDYGGISRKLEKYMSETRQATKGHMDQTKERVDKLQSLVVKIAKDFVMLKKKQ
jgi:polyhydroxyalkanoate synthesis regulator phasin